MTDAPDGSDGPQGAHGADGADGADVEYYPDFRTVRRGYDPDEVEQVLDDLYASLSDAARDAEEHARRRVAAEREQAALRSMLAEARRRVAELESRPVGDPDTFAGVGSRVSEVLRAASAEAAEIVRRAQEEAEAAVREAEEYRARVRTELAQVRERLAAALDEAPGPREDGSVDDGVRD